MSQPKRSLSQDETTCKNDERTTCRIIASIEKGLCDSMILKRQTEESGGGGLGTLTSNLGSLQSGFGQLAETMKDGKMVVGGFSFLVIPNPNLQQLQGIQSQLPSIPSLPG